MRTGNAYIVTDSITAAKHAVAKDTVNYFQLRDGFL